MEDSWKTIVCRFVFNNEGESRLVEVRWVVARESVAGRGSKYLASMLLAMQASGGSFLKKNSNHLVPSSVLLLRS